MATLASPLMAAARPGAVDRSFGRAGTVHLGFGLVPSPYTWNGVVLASPRGGSFVVGGRFSVARRLPGGAPDRSFGAGGFVQVHFPGYSIAQATGAALQSDGKLVVVGSTTSYRCEGHPDHCPPHMAIARLTSKGALDRSFGAGDGMVVPRRSAQARTVRVLSSGQMLLAGTSRGSPTLARFSQGGRLDRSFGHRGFATGAGGSTSAVGLALDRRGRILVLGSGGGGVSGPEVLRFTRNGKPDATFGSQGEVMVAVPGQTFLHGAGGIAVGANQEILLTATAGWPYRLALIQLRPNGALDGDYGDGGIALAPESFRVRFNIDLALQGDGRAVAAAAVYGGTAMARFLPNGNLDPTFGEGGTTPDLSSWGMRASLALEPHGGLLTADSDRQLRGVTLARYRDDGSLDDAFADHGVAQIEPEGDSRDIGRALLVGRRGRVTVVGKTNHGVAIARLRADGRLDRSFGGDGTVQLDLRGSFALTAALARDGSLVIGGTAPLHSPTRRRARGLLLARYTRNGRLDRDFGEGGVVVADLGPSDYYSTVRALAIRRDGGILAAGDSNTYEGRGAVVLFRRDGTLDRGFGKDGIVRLPQVNTFDSIALLAGGTIGVGGSNLVRCGKHGCRWNAVTLRLHPDGRRDRSFGRDGAVTTHRAYGVSTARYGKGLLVTSTHHECRGRDATGDDKHPCGEAILVRRSADGSLDRSFGRAGTARSSGWNAVAASTIAPDGRIFMTGSRRGRIAVEVFNADGTRDRDFGIGGFTAFGSALGDSGARAIGFQPGLGVLVGGSDQQRIGGTQFAVTRLHVR